MQKETIIRKAITDALKVSGWDVTYHLQGVGCRKGFPDLTAMKNGQTVYIEVKTETGRLSAYQKEFQSICHKHGCTYIVARSVKDVADLLEFKVLF